MTSKKHHKIIAGIFFVLGLLNVLGWISIGGWNFDAWMFLAYSVFFVITGVKIHNDTPGAKVFGVIASLLSISSFPVGTAIGVYGMWVLLMSDRK